MLQIRFGGLGVGGDEDGQARTVRNEVPTPPDEDEMPDLEGLRAWMASEYSAMTGSSLVYPMPLT
jgi:hypothetical protein